MILYPDATTEFMRASVARTAASKRVYRGTLQNLQSAHRGQHVHQFTPAQLTDFCFAVLGDGPPAVATIKARKTRLVGFFSWARYRGLIDVDPSTDLKFTVRPRGGAARTHTWLTEPELAQLLRAVAPCGDKGARARVIVMLGALMGLRREEIARLRWSDLTPDLSRMALVGKGNKLAELGVPKQVREALNNWRATAPDGAVYVVPHLWTGRADWAMPVTPEVVALEAKWAGRQAGFELATHDLRRTFAGILEGQGMDVRKIQLLMRHDDLSTTIGYLEKNPAKVAGLADTFEVAL